MKNKHYWVSTTYATGIVEVNELGVIITTAPIWAKWRNQYF